MAARFSDIEASSLGPQSLDARLKTYQELRAKIETMLTIIENACGDIEKAAVAEPRVIDAMRELGNDVLQSWAYRQQQHKEAECQAKPGVSRKKTLYWPQATCLIDFYHLCDYLAAAADVVAGPEKAAWLEEKKTWLKANQWPAVLDTLRPYVEPNRVANDDAPVRACFRYSLEPDDVVGLPRGLSTPFQKFVHVFPQAATASAFGRASLASNLVKSRRVKVHSNGRASVS